MEILFWCMTVVGAVLFVVNIVLSRIRKKRLRDEEKKKLDTVAQSD